MRIDKNPKEIKTILLRFILALSAVMVLIVVYQGKQKMSYLNELKSDVAGLQDNLTIKEQEVNQANSEKQAALENISQLETNYKALKQQTDEMTKKIDKKQSQIGLLTEGIIGPKANDLISAIKQDDFKKISKIIHPEKGVRLSPSPAINEKHQLIMSSKLVDLSKDYSNYEWGLVDSQGSQILLTFDEYYKQYIKDEDCLTKGSLQYANELADKSINLPTEQASSLYSEGIYVDCLYKGTVQNNYADWKSIRFVFEEYQSSWYLTAIITNKS